MTFLPSVLATLEGDVKALWQGRSTSGSFWYGLGARLDVKLVVNGLDVGADGGITHIKTILDRLV